MEDKKLRSGFTTGTCAAGAAKAAAVLLLKNEPVDCIRIMTPGGTEAEFIPAIGRRLPDSAMCSVIKDAGDDPDVTDKAEICAAVEYVEHGENLERCYRRGRIFLTGGMGVGIVTKPGLACPVGLYAINPVPQRMIFDEVEAVLHESGYDGELLVRISIPAGERLALSTFNPRLGIEGGISVLGTSGIVVPMSEAALKATIRLELHMKAAAGRKEVILTPGNYGKDFLKERLGLSLSQGVQCSNFAEDSVKMARDEGMEAVLFVGHIGKLIKVAGGVGNTHSKYGDRRMELMWDCAGIHVSEMEETARAQLARRVLASNTTEEAVAHLEKAGIAEAVMRTAADRVREQIEKWYGGPVKAGVVTFTKGCGILGMTCSAEAMIGRFRSREVKNLEEEEIL